MTDEDYIDISLLIYLSTLLLALSLWVLAAYNKVVVNTVLYSVAVNLLTALNLFFRYHRALKKMKEPKQ